VKFVVTELSPHPQPRSQRERGEGHHPALSGGENRYERARGAIALEWALIGGGIAALTVTEEYNPGVAWGMGALALAFILRAWRRRRVAERTGLEAPLALFLAAAALGVLVAYERGPAVLQYGRILAGVVLFYSVLALRAYPRLLSLLAWGFVLAAAGLALYTPTQIDYSLEMGNPAPVQSLGLWINANVAPLPGPGVNPNVGAGVLVLAAPFAAGLWLHEWQKRRWLAGLAGLVAMVVCLVILFGLFMTGSRGGWIGTAGMLGLGVLVLAQRRFFPRGAVLFWAVAAAVLAAGGWVLVYRLDGLARLAEWMPGSGGVDTRVKLWMQTVPLARDYVFSGIGLMAFRLVHSTYATLMHTPHLDHAHNALIEVWLETGVFGFLAVMWMSAVVAVGFVTRGGRPADESAGDEVSSLLKQAEHEAQRDSEPASAGLGSAQALTPADESAGDEVSSLLKQAEHEARLDFEPASAGLGSAQAPVSTGDELRRALGLTGALALAGAALHGLFDVVFFVERTLPLLGFCAGYAALLWVGIGDGHSAIRRSRRSDRLWILGTLALLLLVEGGIFHRQLLAAFYANLGSVAQARAELTRYDPAAFDTLSLDMIRQSTDLSAAEGFFERALAWDGGNLTAHQRLAEIELSRGQYQAALVRTQAMWDAGRRDEISRLLYGDALAANARPQEAAEVIRGLYRPGTRMMGEAWYRYWVNGDIQRAKDAWETVMTLYPGHNEATKYHAQALKILGGE